MEDGRRERIEAHPGVLHVDHEHVEPFKVLGERLRLPAIQADHWKSGVLVDTVLDFLSRRSQAAEAMLGAKELHELHSTRGKRIDRMFAVVRL